MEDLEVLCKSLLDEPKTVGKNQTLSSTLLLRDLLQSSHQHTTARSRSAAEPIDDIEQGRARNGNVFTVWTKLDHDGTGVNIPPLRLLEASTNILWFDLTTLVIVPLLQNARSMGNLRKIALSILVLCFFVFVALFGRLPTLRNTPIGFLHRLIWIHIPSFFQALDRRITGGRLTSLTVRLAHYLMHENHPLVLIFFLSLLTSSAGFFLYHAWFHLQSYHHVLIPPILVSPYIFTYLCVTSTASYITPANHHTHMRFYPYDHIIYHPGTRCRTCLFQKPARSKHCSVCKTCIAKHDHHCIWVNNCLGRDNYRWFLALLLSLGIVISYGAGLAYGILAPQVPPGRPGLTGLLDAWALAVVQDVGIGAVGLLALLTAPLAWGLFFYHIYLVWAGMTTNETGKWEDWKLDMADGIAFKAERPRRSAFSALEPPTQWPAVSKLILVTTDDGKPPLVPSGSELDKLVGGNAQWQRCWQLDEVTNIYDLGFWDNLMDALKML